VAKERNKREAKECKDKKANKGPMDAYPAEENSCPVDSAQNKQQGKQKEHR